MKPAKMNRRDLLRLSAPTALGAAVAPGALAAPAPSPAAEALIPGLDDDSAYNWLTVLA